MTDRRTEIAKSTAAALRGAAEHIRATPILIGFDGFVDSIIRVVETRHDAERYDPIPTIKDFGEKIVAADGESANFEFVVTLRKLGGNGPIMANAMAHAGFKVGYVGCLGDPSIDPVFEDFTKIAHVQSIAEPGFTDALEFSNGKLMLGKHGSLRHVNQTNINSHIGEQTYNGMVADAKFIGMVNWTMLTELESIWTHLRDVALPQAGQPIDRRRVIFIDLADPAKRSREDIRRALHLAADLDAHADVILGLNLSEAQQVAGVLSINPTNDPEDLATEIRAGLNLYAVVVHPRTGAGAAIREGDGESIGLFKGPFVKHPKISTGAGDNFNAGFCLGQMAGLDVEQSLCAGTATSGFYVRNAHSPSLEELADFCDVLPDPE